MSSKTKYAYRRVSMNSKTGPIPVTTTSGDTCSPTCAFYGDRGGCYARGGRLALHWQAVERGERGIEWAVLLSELKRLPKGQLWRHNDAGDLPGRGSRINVRQLAELVAAQRGRRGFTFTHKPLTPTNTKAIRHANDNGFAVNLSADSLADADAKAASGAGPVVVVLPKDAPDKGIRTPEGRHVVVCPAQTQERFTCSQCGLCAVIRRKSIVGFKAHGVWQNKVSLKVIP